MVVGSQGASRQRLHLVLPFTSVLEEPTFVHGLEDGWSAGAMPLLLTQVYHICSWPGKSTYVSRDLSFIGGRSCSRFQSAWIAPDLRRRNPGSHAPHARSKAESAQCWICQKQKVLGGHHCRWGQNIKAFFGRHRRNGVDILANIGQTATEDCGLIQTCAHMSWSSEATKADWLVAVEWLLIMTCCCY